MSISQCSNASLAATAISTAIHLGVTDFVICAGARNVPLIADLTARSDLTLWHHFDERSAAFFGLGLAKVNRKPVAIVTTSGTAVAELFPAIIEASYSGIPLVVITADRPVRFRGSGAPQAIEQAGIFSAYVGCFIDLEPGKQPREEIFWDRKSPLHLNVCFEEPQPEPVESSDSLTITIQNSAPETSPPPLSTFENPIALVAELNEEERSAAKKFLLETKIPAWFEATSGLRECRDLESQRIDQEIGIAEISPREVIRIGSVPSLRYWRDLEEKPEVHVINVTQTGFPGLARSENVSNLGFSKLPELTRHGNHPKKIPAHPELPSTLAAHPQSEPALVHKLSKIIPGTAPIFLGNSMPIREWNLAATTSIPHPLCFANRGANGIDGEVSTFLGISATYQESWGIFGDLTAMYDLNSPWLFGQLPPGKRRIVILNNGGGKIFSSLPAMKNLKADVMKMTENQHDLDFSAWADLWKVEYLNWAGDSENWESPKSDHSIIELEIDPRRTEAFWDQYR